MATTATTIQSVLTRTCGFLKTVCSHSLQPYRGCPFGQALCGVGCYVQHSGHLTRGRAWGSFLEVRVNAAESYRRTVGRERAWARRARDGLKIFMSSATEPFPPQERRWGVTRAVLEAMLDQPPDGLIVQTRSPLVAEYQDLLVSLRDRCDLRVHISIETDLEHLPGLPPHATSIAQRFAAAASLKAVGVPVVVTVSPLLPIADPARFFARVAAAADAVVLDHFIGGDGSVNGARTRRTALPEAMLGIDPGSVDLAYRDRMAEVAERHLPGKVGLGSDGFAGRWGRRDESVPQGAIVREPG